MQGSSLEEKINREGKYSNKLFLGTKKYVRRNNGKLKMFGRKKEARGKIKKEKSPTMLMHTSGWKKIK